MHDVFIQAGSSSSPDAGPPPVFFALSYQSIGDRTSNIPFPCAGNDAKIGYIKNALKALRRRIPEHEVQQATGIEPASPAWEAGVLPMNYACTTGIYYKIEPDESQRPKPEEREKS
jgi:hypothetical protein